MTTIAKTFAIDFLWENAMKKIILSFLTLTVVVGLAYSVPTSGNQRNEENWGDISYMYVPIIKVFDSRDGYVVFYQKSHFGTGKTVIPKEWSRGTVEAPKKLKIRNLPAGKLKSYMTVVKKDGEFLRVILTVPADKRNDVWGVVKAGSKVDGLDKENLDDVKLF